MAPISTIDTPAQNDRLLADVVAQRQVVGDEEDAHAAAFEFRQQVEDVDPRGGVQHADDLVGDEDLEVEQQRPGHEQALELAAAELVGILVQDLARVEADAPQRLFHLGVPLRGRDMSGEVLGADHREHPVRLEYRVVRAERVLEYALDLAVVRLDRLAVDGCDIRAVER